ncbi:AAA family ATPase [Flavobacterium sp. 102]|uniref:AAA family ATPase n=1 Tax=Flavobacterium sp. 102 TaxID=2135623 RepID=UPI000EB599EA|nr:AAA family ATPase [Flavobacterium sp. 102]RKS03015.1 ATPase family protein associated with various cellular activities (AAA) [Flavobacterium sp. 102]
METEIKTHYNYHEIVTWLEQKGIELYGNHFKILEIDYPIIYKLIAYFLKDEASCFQYNISINKGILLSGPIGCGKTTLMSIMKYLTPAEHKFFVKPCREISFEFIQDGYQIIHKYSKGKLYESEPKIICFDDLGTENNLKYYGNECNVMAEILLSRYDIFIAKKIPTHITTNLSASEIETHYGKRVRSRMRELFNLIAYDNNTKDKR